MKRAPLGSERLRLRGPQKIVLPELGTLSRQGIASLVGLAPFNNDSGQSPGTRRIRGGRSTIRHALDMATLVASKQNPTIKAHDQKTWRVAKRKRSHSSPVRESS